MSYHGESGVITGVAAGTRKPTLFAEVRRRMRLKHYSLATERIYVQWIRRFIVANGKRHPRELGGEEVERFLSRLATEGDVAASTQNQALSALLFLYREVLRIDLPWMEMSCARSARIVFLWCWRSTKSRACSQRWTATDCSRACFTEPVCA